MKKLILILLLLTAAAPAAIFINSFNSGQLSKDLKVRQDLDKATMGSETLQNILVRPQGMAFKRPGTEFIDSRIREVNIPTTQTVIVTVTTREYPTLQELTDEEIPNAPATPSDTTLVAPTSVTDKAGLQAIAGAGHYTIDANIDASGDWTPIQNFSGVIEGNNYTISNLAISAGSTDYRALFYNLNTGAEIRNLNFEDCTVVGDEYVAILASRINTQNTIILKNITFTDCTVTGRAYIGCLIGQIYSSYGISIYDCDVINCDMTVTSYGYEVMLITEFMSCGVRLRAEQ
jgi:uncharacterized protein YxeA